MAQPARDQLTLGELYALFHSVADPWGKELGLADSLDTLAVCTYLIRRSIAKEET